MKLWERRGGTHRVVWTEEDDEIFARVVIFSALISAGLVIFFGGVLWAVVH